MGRNYFGRGIDPPLNSKWWRHEGKKKKPSPARSWRRRHPRELRQLKQRKNSAPTLPEGIDIIETRNRMITRRFGGKSPAIGGKGTVRRKHKAVSYFATQQKILWTRTGLREQRHRSARNKRPSPGRCSTCSRSSQRPSWCFSRIQQAAGGRSHGGRPDARTTQQHSACGLSGGLSATSFLAAVRRPRRPPGCSQVPSCS